LAKYHEHSVIIAELMSLEFTQGEQVVGRVHTKLYVDRVCIPVSGPKV